MQLVKAGRSLRTGIAVGASLLALAAAAGVGPASASASASTISTHQVEHWGTFFGDASAGAAGTQLSPAGVTMPGKVTEIATSNSTQYALLANGQVWAWGLGNAGQLGTGGTANSLATPVLVHFPTGVKIAFLPADAMPYDSAMAVDTTGHVWGWGANSGGEFCLGKPKSYTTPVKLPFTKVTTLAGAADHATYDAHGTLYSCGTNTYGELGDDSTASSHVPVKVKVLSGASVTALVASWGNTGALLSGGKYYDWGMNGEGQLGTGSTAHLATGPVHVKLPAPVTVAALGGSLPGNGQTLVKLGNGELFAWGADGSGQLDNGKKMLAQRTPLRFHAPSGVTYRTLATSGATSYAIATTGNVYAWGNGDAGQVGDGTESNALAPVLVASGAAGISATADDVAIREG